MDYRVLTLTGVFWFLADQLTKAWAQSVYFKPMVLIENFFYFSMHKNTGIAFGIPLPSWLQLIVSAILIGILIYLALSPIFCLSFSKKPLKNDGMQGDNELPPEPYEAVRRKGSEEGDTAVRIFQRFPNQWIFGIILGGAIGNWVSRAMEGGVIDFIVLKPFPVFNIADIGITVGLVLLFILSLKKPKK